MRRLKVLMYEPSGTGGIAIYAKHLCTFLSKENCDIQLLTTNPSELSGKLNLPFKLTEELKFMFEKQSHRKFKLLWIFDRMYRALSNVYIRKKYAKVYFPDIMHIQLSIPIIDFFCLSNLKKYSKVVYTVHDIFPYEKRLDKLDIFVKGLYKKVDWLIVHTKTNKQQLIEGYGIDEKKISVVPHGALISLIDLPDKDLSRVELNLPSGKFIVLFFGTIRDNKGLDVLLKSFYEIKDVTNDILLIIAGKPNFGDSFAKYKKMIEEYNLEKNVICRVKYIPESEIVYYYRSSDVVVLPYNSFGSQSGVLLQSFSYKKPVIVTDVGGMGETVREDNVGIVVKPGSSEQLTKAILSMYKSKAQYEKFENNLSLALRKKYGWNIVAYKTIDIYENICNM